MSTKNILIGVGVIIGAFLLYGAYQYPQSTTTVVQTSNGSFGSAVGTTFNTAKFAGVNMSPATAAATTTSILNGDASDRIATSIDVDCNTVGTSQTFLTGGGLTGAGLTLKIATTSVANLGLQNNTNLVGGTVTIATGTPDILIASSTPSFGGTNVAAWDRWAAGSYLTFLFSATNTAACTVGVKYMAT